MPLAAKTHRVPYRSTTRHAQALYPFIADAPLDTPGVVIGRDALGRVVRFDPFRLYQAGQLHGPNMLVLGDIGYGVGDLGDWLWRTSRDGNGARSVVRPVILPGM